MFDSLKFDNAITMAQTLGQVSGTHMSHMKHTACHMLDVHPYTTDYPTEGSSLWCVRLLRSFWWRLLASENNE